MSWRSHVAPRLALVAGLAAFSAVAPGWSNPISASGLSAQGQHYATALRVQAGALSGKWSGSYSGSYSGTFKLSWQQSGANLSGTIKILVVPGRSHEHPRDRSRLVHPFRHCRLTSDHLLGVGLGEFDVRDVEDPGGGPGHGGRLLACLQVLKTARP